MSETYLSSNATQDLKNLPVIILPLKFIGNIYQQIDII